MIKSTPLALSAVLLTSTTFSAHAGVDISHMTSGHQHLHHYDSYAVYEERVIETPQAMEVERRMAIVHEDDQGDVEVDAVSEVEGVEYDDGDPIEDFNRVIFFFNDMLDAMFFTPICKIYRGVVHDEIRARVSYVLRNVREPVNFANNILQADFEEAGITLGRFVTNTTVGVGGIFDVGTDWGMPFERQDFGMTMASWGIGEGGYLMLPILGPSTFREAPGIAVDIALDPMTWFIPSDAVAITYARAGAQGLDDYNEVQPMLEDLRKNSLDFYIGVRAWYLERRRSKVREALGDSAQPADSPVPMDFPQTADYPTPMN